MAVEFRLVPPIHVLPPFSADDKAYAEKMGFVFGPVAQNDPLAYLVQIPEGWIELTDRGKTPREDEDYLFDQNEQRRVLLTSGRSTLLTRYHDYGWRIPGENRSTFSVKDRKWTDSQRGRTLFYGKDRHGDDGAAGYAECQAWLDKHKPDWRNPAAYWNDP